MGAVVLGLATHKKHMAKTFHEVYTGNFLTKFHNTLQEYFCCDISTGGSCHPLLGS